MIHRDLSTVSKATPWQWYIKRSQTLSDLGTYGCHDASRCSQVPQKLTTECNHGRTHTGWSAWWNGKHADLGRQRTNRLEQYDSWTKYITDMKKPDNYAGALFMFGLSAFHNVAVGMISDSYDEPHVYYLGFLEPTVVTTVCFPSTSRYCTNYY